MRADNPHFKGLEMEEFTKVGNKYYYKNIVSKNLQIIRVGSRVLVFDHHIDINGDLRQKIEWEAVCISLDEFKKETGDIAGLETIYHVVKYLVKERTWERLMNTVIKK